MDKINFRFGLLRARFPELYKEAQKKIEGGVDRKDIIADWLNELVCRREMFQSTPILPQQAAETNVEIDDINSAISAMDSLKD